MFTFSTVRTLIESQLASTHPLRRVVAYLKGAIDRLPPPARTAIKRSDEKPPVIPRAAILHALTWRLLYSIRGEALLKEALRFDLRCQWFVGFCLEERDWTHAMFDRAVAFYLAEPSTTTFFEGLAAFLEAEGLLKSDCFTIDRALLRTWADPSSILAADTRDVPPPSGTWKSFAGARKTTPAAIPTPAEAWRLNLSLGTVRALANAHLGPLSARESPAPNLMESLYQELTGRK